MSYMSPLIAVVPPPPTKSEDCPLPFLLNISLDTSLTMETLLS